MKRKSKAEVLEEKVEEVKQKSKSYNTIGEYSDEIKAKHEDKMSDEEKERELYKRLVKYQKNNQLLWGTIVSTGWQKLANKEMPVIRVNWNGVLVVIPDEWFWLNNMEFGKSYSRKVISRNNGINDVRETTETEKANIRSATAKFYINAEICFTIKAVSWDLIKGNEIYEGKHLVSAIGNRVEACNILQDKYFFHKNHLSNKEPINLKVGDAVEAHVIGVKEDCVLVEACGVETRLDSYTLSDDFISNCMKVVKSGDQLKLFIHKLEVSEGNVRLSLTGRTTVTPKTILQMQVRNYYGGHVLTYNNESNIYTIVLNNKVRACVHKDRVEGYQDLVPGDEVRVLVTNILDKYVIGNCIKMG